MANNNSSSQISTLLEQSLAGITRGSSSPTGSSGVSDSSGNQTSAMTQQLQSLTEQLQQLQTVNQTQIETMEQNTQALARGTTAKAQGSSGSVGGSIGSTLLSVLGLGTGLSPLISGLISLFGGGGGSSPQPLIPYVAPLPISATAGINASSSGAAFAVNNGTVGLPQPVPSSTPAATPQITVQVQAMDSQSFLDHSNDIALAVRQAMLESSVLNDVIRGG